jgi:hypothetical protein
LELEDVGAFQVHLVSTGISWSALDQIVCAPRFFYGVTLGEALIPERIHVMATRDPIRVAEVEARLRHAGPFDDRVDAKGADASW